MFYKDGKGIEVCQLGKGDILVSDVYLEGIRPKDCVGVVFGEVEEGEINRELPEFKNKMDHEANVRFKLLFTNPNSIDVVVNALQAAKESMNEDTWKKG